MSTMKAAYLAVEGDLNTAVGSLDTLARLIADRDDETSVGIADLMFDQIVRLKRVQSALDDAHRNDAEN